MSNAVFSAKNVDHLITRSEAALPKKILPAQRKVYQKATRIVIESICRRLSLRTAPDLRDVEAELRGALSPNVPDRVVRSRVVLCFRDCMQDRVFNAAFTSIGWFARRKCVGEWAEMSSELYRRWPDKVIAGRPAVAINILAGSQPVLQTALTRSFTEEINGHKAGFLSRIMNAASGLLGGARPASARALQEQTVEANLAAIPQQKPAPKKQKPVKKKSKSTGTTMPVLHGAQKKKKNNGARKPGFMARIKARFIKRGLAPVAMKTGLLAARIMAERVKRGQTPSFDAVEYEVMFRTGEGIAPGAVRTWTLHAFMECMRDRWFRTLFNRLPLEDRAEAVCEWANAAAKWFDVPGKMSDFWIKALSGGDPVLAAAAEPAFRKQRAIGGQKAAALPASEEAAEKARRSRAAASKAAKSKTAAKPAEMRDPDLVAAKAKQARKKALAAKAAKEKQAQAQAQTEAESTAKAEQKAPAKKTVKKATKPKAKATTEKKTAKTAATKKKTAATKAKAPTQKATAAKKKKAAAVKSAATAKSKATKKTEAEAKAKAETKAKKAKTAAKKANGSTQKAAQKKADVVKKKNGSAKAAKTKEAAAQSANGDNKANGGKSSRSRSFVYSIARPNIALKPGSIRITRRSDKQREEMEEA